MGAGLAARISKNFLYKESGKCIFYKESKSNKTNLTVGRGGVGVKDLFYFFQV